MDFFAIIIFVFFILYGSVNYISFIYYLNYLLLYLFDIIILCYLFCCSVFYADFVNFWYSSNCFLFKKRKLKNLSIYFSNFIIIDYSYCIFYFILLILFYLLIFCYIIYFLLFNFKLYILLFCIFICIVF